MTRGVLFRGFVATCILLQLGLSAYCQNANYPNVQYGNTRFCCDTPTGRPEVLIFSKDKERVLDIFRDILLHQPYKWAGFSAQEITPYRWVFSTPIYNLIPTSDLIKRQDVLKCDVFGVEEGTRVVCSYSVYGEDDTFGASGQNSMAWLQELKNRAENVKK